VKGRDDIQAIVLDNQLGWTTGVELLPRIREIWPTTPIVMFTVTGSEEMAVKIMKLGVDDYLLKSPTQYARLPHVIEQLVAQYRMRSALHHSELINQSMISNIQEGIIVYDKELRYVVWNRFMEEITGKYAEEVIGHVAHEVFPHLIESGIREILLQVLNGETLQSSDIPYFVENTGRVGWTQGTYSPLRNAQGQVYGVLATLHDITERKLNETEREALLINERQRTLQLANLNIAAKDIAASVDKNMLYHLLKRHLTQLSAAQNCRILLSQDRLGQIVLKDVTPNSESGDTLVIPTPDQMTALENGKPQIINLHPSSSDEPARWLMRLAVQAQQKVVALIELNATGIDNPFNEQAQILAQTLLEHVGIAITEIDLLDQERLLRRQAETLRDVARLLNTPDQLHIVLNLILEQLKNVVQFDHATVMLIHDDRIRIEAAQGGINVEAFLNYEFRLEENRVIHPCIYAQQRVYIPNVHENPEWIVVNGLEQVHAWVATPLISRGVCFGVLTVDGFTIDQFKSHDLDFVTTFASYAANAIENARLLTETTEALTREQKLNEIVHTISQDLESKALMEAVAAQATAVVNGEIAAVVLYDEESGKIIDLFYYNQPENLHFEEHEMNDHDGLIWDVLEKGQIVVEADYSAHPNAMHQWIEQDVHGFVAVPLRAGEKIVGGLAIFSRHPTRVFDERDVATLESIGRQAGIGLENARLYEELEEAFVETVLALANAMDVRDSYTSEHSQRMAALAVEVGRKLGSSHSELEALRWAALLHDIGKIGVPDDILLKPSSLTRKEYETIKRHPELGASIVSPVKKLNKVAPIIRGHQEWFNGKGYPDGLKGENIPLGARILAVVDSYTAITDERVYRLARSHAAAVDELRKGSGSQYDPKVVDVFLETVEEMDSTKKAEVTK
jgi:PAS domain S-box-containing protein/putative nucleotidyltransferase with HDIG domain